jgi:hypothetical protein
MFSYQNNDLLTYETTDYRKFKARSKKIRIGAESKTASPRRKILFGSFSHGMMFPKKVTTALIETFVDELNVGMALLSIARETLTKYGV